MPEESELDLDTLHERIHEEAEHQGGGFLRLVALTTACLAALAAVASLQAGATVNEALVRKTEATQLQSRASDQWGYYQAKGIKAVVTEAVEAAWRATGKSAPTSLDAVARRYAGEQRAIAAVARRYERARDEASERGDHLLHRHHGFANAVALFQVAIALGAVTALTRSKPVYAGSLLLGGAGVVLFAWQYF